MSCMKKMSTIKPNFFVAGGSKCGTTNISYYLQQHPKIFFSELNEPYYFAKNDVPKNFKRDSMITEYREYLDLFKNAKDAEVVGEASSVYLACPNAPKLIFETFPNAKILISIRNPIERAHSAYFSYKFMQLNEESFSEMIEIHKKLIDSKEFFIYSILESGFYTEKIKRYQKIFPKDNIKIIIFEEYIKNSLSHINDILDFLGVDSINELNDAPKGAYRVPKNKISNMLLKSKLFRNTASKLIPTVKRQEIGDRFLVKQASKPQMNDKDRERLKEIYSEEVKRLKEHLQLDLPWNDFKD